MSATTAEPKFTGIAPCLMVADPRKSARYYQDVLTFQVDFVDEGFAIVARDGVRILLQEGQGEVYRYGPWAAYIWVNDADALFSAFVANGAEITSTLKDTSWGTRDFQVADPDGYQLRFSQILRSH